jgi:hypothetical protein
LRYAKFFVDIMRNAIYICIMQTNDKEQFENIFSRLSEYSQSILISQIQLAYMAETAVKRQYGISDDVPVHDAEASDAEAV